MAFVESEGYEFTLEELTSAFKQKAQLPPETEDTAPAPPDVSASAPPGAEVTAIPLSPTAPTPRRNECSLTESGERRPVPGAIEAGGAGTAGRNSPQGPGGKVNGRIVQGWRGQTPGVFPREIKVRLGGRFVSRP